MLQDVSLEVRPGETLAIVGPTGAGKSTIAGLVPRFHDPSTGHVTLDGIDLREITLKSLRSHVSVVLQQPFLFPMTTAENIAYSRHASSQAIEDAAKAANAHEFIRRDERSRTREVHQSPDAPHRPFLSSPSAWTTPSNNVY